MSAEASKGFPVKAIIKVDSDWGSVVLITSNAVIDKIPNIVYPPDVRFTGTQLFVGEQESLRSQKQDIPFHIFSNGLPIDIITAHGDASTGPEPGNVTVEIPPIGAVLYNDDNTGDGVNVKVFPRISVPV